MMELGRHVVFQTNIWEHVKSVVAHHGETAISWARSTKMEESLQIKAKIRSLRESRNSAKKRLDDAAWHSDEEERNHRVARLKSNLEAVGAEMGKEEEALLGVVFSNVLSLGKIRVSWCLTFMEQ